VSITNPYLDHSIADLITRAKGLNAIYDKVAAISISAADIWSYTTRTLTSPSFGDIVTKNLTDILADSTAFNGADIATIKGYLESGGAIYDFIDEIESLLKDATYGLSALNTDLDTLLSRLTATRAGYLDNLSGGAVALEATLDAIKGTGWTNETLKAIKDAIDALNDIAASDVWAYATRTLTSHAFPFTNPASAIDLSNVRVALQSDPLNVIRDAILSDATKFAGANIDAAISSRSSHSAADVWSVATRTLTNPASEQDLTNMKVTAIPKSIDESGSFTWDTSSYGTNETDISALFTTDLTGTTRRKYTVYLDLTNVAGDTASFTVTIRVKVKIDGANYRTIDKKDIAKADLAADEEPGVPIDIPPVAQDVQITMKFDTALASDQTIYYHYVKEVLE